MLRVYVHLSTCAEKEASQRKACGPLWKERLTTSFRRAKRTSFYGAAEPSRRTDLASSSLSFLYPGRSPSSPLKCSCSVVQVYVHPGSSSPLEHFVPRKSLPSQIETRHEIVLASQRKWNGVACLPQAEPLGRSIHSSFLLAESEEAFQDRSLSTQLFSCGAGDAEHFSLVLSFCLDVFIGHIVSCLALTV